MYSFFIPRDFETSFVPRSCDDFDDFGEGYIYIYIYLCCERGESQGRKSGDEELKGWKRLWDGVEVSRRDTRVEHPRTPPAKRDETTLPAKVGTYVRYKGREREREISLVIYKNKGLIFFLARTSIRCPEAAVFCRPKCANMFHFVRACIRGKRGIDAFRNPSENLPRWEMAESWKV